MTPQVRKIDRWFPIDAVDEACNYAVGSGLVEQALMTWFASRPIAQARAAVLTALLPDANGETQRLVDIAVRGYDAAARESGGPDRIDFKEAVRALSERIEAQFDGGPVVLDPFSGRGIIPLEAARFGAKAIATDLAPLAVLASRLLADYPYRDWPSGKLLPSDWYSDRTGQLLDDERPALVRDLEIFLARLRDSIRHRARPMYPQNEDGTWPWGYLWAISVPCDGCQRRFPVVGSLVLRFPKTASSDLGQSIRLETAGNGYSATVVDGTPQQNPTFRAPEGKRNKVARCIHCDRIHSRDALKAKGIAGEFRDDLLVVAEHGPGDPAKVFRSPTQADWDALAAVPSFEVSGPGELTPIPSEPIPEGNVDAVRASAYGFTTYGSLMVDRQAKQFALTAELIRSMHAELLTHGVDEEYATALAGYATATLARKIRRATRGATLLMDGDLKGTKGNGCRVRDIYADESKINFSFDYFEAGIGEGPGTFDSLAFDWKAGTAYVVSSIVVPDQQVKALGGRFRHDWREHSRPARVRQASATSLPLRDASVDVVVTDPPYYNMIDYSDASDLLYVWARRALHEVMPDVFGDGAGALQPKADEIIVKRGGGSDEHRTKSWYHAQLAKAFGEMRRVLKPDGHLTVVFGHHDPDAWVRLLGALRDAGFVVTSSWPSRTESGNTGVASIKVTVSIGCRVAPEGRPDGLMNQVDLEIRNEVAARVKRWTDDGLALPDQLMAAYGPAMEVYGRYENVLQPNGEPVDLERYLLLARAVVKDTVAMKVDELPLETFDAETRLAVAWLRFYGHTVVQKGEARFMAQTEAIRIDDVRDLFVESKNGFKLNTEPTDVVVIEKTPVFGLVLAMCARMAGETDGDLVGVDGAASVLAAAEATGAVSKATDPHVWAVVSELHQKLSDSSKTGKALARIVRSRQQIVNAADRGRSKVAQQVDRDLAQQTLDLTGEDA